METQKCKLSDFLEIETLNHTLISELRDDFYKRELLSMAIINLAEGQAALCDSPVDIFRDNIQEVTATLMSIRQLIESVANKISCGYDRERFYRCMNKSRILNKLEEQSTYSFIVKTIGEKGHNKIEKFTFAAIDRDKKYIIWNNSEITSTLEYDILTGGRNRAGFLHLMQDALDAYKEGDELTLLYFNIQSFHHINELYGMQAGDAVLQHFYTSIGYSSIFPITYSRTESDHFYCLIHRNLFNEDEITSLCRQEISFNGKRIPYHCLCGIYNITDITESPANMCGRASIAANYVNDPFKQPFKEFDDKMRKRYISDSEVVDRLEYALANNEFMPYYQPIVNVRTGRIEMAEALARWNSARYGFVSPADFIPSLEKHGGISRVDMYMANHVFATIKNRTRENKPIVPIDVNVSWIDFGDPEYVAQLISHLEDEEVTTDMCRYEITESTIAEMTESRRQLLDIFANKNGKLIIDDFGKGYSFSTMRDIDFYIIKLDKSLIDQITLNEKADLLVESLIGMFHKMGAKVVAEGVEKLQQVEYLRLVGCDYIQGFYYYRPMPEADFLALLDKQAKETEIKEEDSQTKTVWIERDVLEAQYNQMKKANDEAECLRKLLDHEHLLYFEWDVQTHIDICSDSFKELYNLPSNEIHNMPEEAGLCHPDDLDRFREVYYRASKGEKFGMDYFRLLAPDGKSYIWYRKTFYTIFDQEKKPYKVILTMRDCTYKYRYDSQLKRNDLLVRQQEVITFSYTVSDDTLEFTFLAPNGQVSQIAIPEYLSSNNSSDSVNDQKLLAAQLREKLHDKNAKSGYIDFYDERFKQDLRAYYSKVESEYGEIYAIVGQAENINRTREKLRETIAQQKEYISVTEGLGKIYNAVATVSLIDNDSRLLLIDPAYDKLLSSDMKWEQITETYLQTVIKPQYTEVMNAFMNRQDVEQRLKGNRYISLEYEDNIFGWVRAYLLPSGFDENGHVTNLLFAAQPISSEKNAIDRLVYLSETDSLTGIRNRYSGEILVEKAIDNKEEGVFAIIDFDKFKMVNDTFGHIVGDNLLMKGAQCLKDVNVNGITMRLGGDEFALYLKGKFTDEDLDVFFGTLFKKIESLEIEGLHDFPIAVSAGAVRYDGISTTDFDTLYKKADNLLYMSKKNAGCRLSY